jgi:hypothetical protein
MTAAAETEDEVFAEVTEYPNGWKLVTFGAWQIGISEDALIRLPHSVDPAQVDELVGCLIAAKEVASGVRAAAEAKEAARTAQERAGLKSVGGLVVTAGKPPAGSVRLPVRAGK